MGKEEIDAVIEVLKSGYYVSGKRVEEFEKKFAKYIGTKYAVAVNSCTAALHIAQMILGIGSGDEVIVPSLTFFATATSVIHAGAIPIFADIDPNIYCIDPKDIIKRITRKTKAIIPVHLYGHPAEMDEIMKIAIDNNLLIIEDCAQAHGAEYKGQRVGSFGHANCWSFFATKNMTTLEGGMITTDDAVLAKEARMVRSHGMSDRNTHLFLGYNYRMNELSGAIGSIQLSRLNEFNRLRTRNSLFLYKKLRNISWLIIPKIKSYVKHAFFWCPVQIDENKLGMTTMELRECLKEKGIGTRHRYLEPLYRQPMLRNYGNYDGIYLPNVEKIAGKMIGLPNHPALRKDSLKYIVSTIKNI